MSIGRHIIADLHEVEEAHLVDAERVSAALEGLLREAGFTILERRVQIFPGGGYTAVVLLAESHASLHSYPEHAYLALDFFSCGSRDPMTVVERFVEQLGRPQVISQVVQRGERIRRGR